MVTVVLFMWLVVVYGFDSVMMLVYSFDSVMMLVYGFDSVMMLVYGLEDVVDGSDDGCLWLLVVVMFGYGFVIVYGFGSVVVLDSVVLLYRGCDGCVRPINNPFSDLPCFPYMRKFRDGQDASWDRGNVPVIHG
ncbi:hypothetical protein A2U01_0018048, partial [Trifolium medium]|nr:hypothetical protein [Trifolium medium]